MDGYIGTAAKRNLEVQEDPQDRHVERPRIALDGSVIKIATSREMEAPVDLDEDALEAEAIHRLVKEYTKPNMGRLLLDWCIRIYLDVCRIVSVLLCCLHTEDEDE